MVIAVASAAGTALKVPTASVRHALHRRRIMCPMFRPWILLRNLQLQYIYLASTIISRIPTSSPGPIDFPDAV
jgi:hypothetical protein